VTTLDAAVVLAIVAAAIAAWYAGRWSGGWRPWADLCAWRDRDGLRCRRWAGHRGPHLVATPSSHGYREVGPWETGP
jgi:hypothetical protein